MSFKVKPRLHLLTYYTLLPNFAFAIALLILSQFGLSDSFKYGAFFSIALGSFCLAIISLFKGLLSEIEFTDGHVIYVTEFGGLADVDLSKLVAEKSTITKSALVLVDANGNKANIQLNLYFAADVEKVLTYILDHIED
ncbi:MULTISPECIES: hypothetical protein [Alteromonadaceae]|uniref:Photosystem I assembly protein Ycf4 n=1 Tax=Brumicola blandensis TaxID=3075611 RepID=A0AAW8R627_9ALTE|nr:MULTISPECIES: hypothetical protein [unclassified Alteromonas]MDT0583882.1 hypothetical protein [Alteromonas sp. W409]MDT0630112.1 hypothetical protein [Alteromonas sp. W364]